jgi:hypothetical protein
MLLAKSEKYKQNQTLKHVNRRAFLFLAHSWHSHHETQRHARTVEFDAPCAIPKPQA